MKSKGYRWNAGKVFDLKGRDVYSWLQGQITQNVLNSSLENPVFFCFCNIGGTIEGIGILLKNLDGVRILVDDKSAHVLEERLNDIILEEVCLEEVSCPIILGFGDRPEKGIFSLCQPGWGEWVSFHELTDIELMTELEWRKLCLINRMPLMGIDIKEKLFPIELGESFNRLYIHYQKGCYVGQEVLMRLYVQGKPRRQWMLFETTVPLRGFLDHPLQVKGLEVTSCIFNKENSYFCGIYVHRNIYSQDNNILIFNEAEEVIGVKL